MRERPILMSSPMVRAILAGTKTVTRRLVKGNRGKVPLSHVGPPVAAAGGRHWGEPGGWIRPYAVAGDRLWVRETWGYRGAAWSNRKPDQHEVTIAYQADNTRRDILRYGKDWDDGVPKQHPPPAPRHEADWDRIESRTEYFGRWWKSWRPSIHMPRWASRLTLEVVSVRVERLREMTPADLVLEGPGAAEILATWPQDAWVWRVEFKRVEAQ